MAKESPTNEANTTNTGAAQPQIAPVAIEGKANDSRAVILDVPMTDGTTKKMARVDYIKFRWQQGKAGRGTIAKELTTLEGRKVTYQTVFAVTKSMPGGPDKAEKAPASTGGAVS